jgi:hypothetical protein
MADNSQIHDRNTNQEHNQRRLGHRIGGAVAGFEITQQRLQISIGELAVAVDVGDQQFQLRIGDSVGGFVISQICQRAHHRQYISG